MYYSDYLQLDKILDAQIPESVLKGINADDEMLFIIIHQTYELWFKQVLYETELVRQIFSKNELKDSAGDISIALHKLARVKKILEVLVKQIDIMETMSTLDFLDFRDLLRPASGFQSIQFKILEATLGLPFQERFGQEYYISQLREADVKRVKEAEHKISLLTYLNNWLERMPFINETYWKGQDFWALYKTKYAEGLVKGEERNFEYFEKFLFEENFEHRKISNKAFRNALFITIYRDCPILQQPWQLLNTLVEIDEQLALWRHRHMAMVTRIIGKRVGTGGSTGAAYLKGAADSHYIFKDLAMLTSFIIPRNQLPVLPDQLKTVLGFQAGF